MNPLVLLASFGLGISAGGLAAADSARTVSTTSPEAMGSVMVTIEGFQFSPSTLEVPVGTSVVFVNKDFTPHTVTPENDQSFQETGRILSDTSKTVVFEKPGTFKYYCEIHTTMRGEVVVK